MKERDTVVLLCGAHALLAKSPLSSLGSFVVDVGVEKGGQKRRGEERREKNIKNRYVYTYEYMCVYMYTTPDGDGDDNPDRDGQNKKERGSKREVG